MASPWSPHSLDGHQVADDASSESSSSGNTNYPVAPAANNSSSGGVSTSFATSPTTWSYSTPTTIATPTTKGFSNCDCNSSSCCCCYCCSSSSSTTPRQCYDRFVEWLIAIPSTISRGFRWYGGLVADRPYFFMIIPLALTISLTPGLSRLQAMPDGAAVYDINSPDALNDANYKVWYEQRPKLCNMYFIGDEPELTTTTTAAMITTTAPPTTTTISNGGNSSSSSSSINATTTPPPAPTSPPQQQPLLCTGSNPPTPDLMLSTNLQLMIVAKDGYNLLDPNVTKELLAMDAKTTFEIYTMSPNVNRPRPIFYSSNVSSFQICNQQPDGSCMQFSPLTSVRAVMKSMLGISDAQAQNAYILQTMSNPAMQGMIDSMIASMPKTTYPFDPSGLLTAPIYGEVVLANTNLTWQQLVNAGSLQNVAASVGAMQFIYTLHGDDDGRAWALEATSQLQAAYANHPMFYLTVQSSWTRGVETTRELIRLIPFAVVCIIGLMIFCAASSIIYGDPLRSKPWIGPIGVICSLSGVLAAFGLCGWVNLQTVDLCYAIPVLVMAVGVDDIFIYKERWAATDPRLTLRDRIATTLKKASPGIVNTSLMNIMAFLIDTGSDFEALHIFSIFSVIASAFDFVYQMTFFPACIALFGKVEVDNKHSCCCCAELEDRTNQTLVDKSVWYLANKTAALGDSRQLQELARMTSTASMPASIPMGAPRPPFKPRPPPAHVFFRDVYVPNLLQRKTSIIIVGVIYVGYIVASALLFSKYVHVGLKAGHFQPNNPDGMDGMNTIQVYMKYYRTFSFSIDIFFEGSVDFWNVTTQLSMQNFARDLYAINGIGPAGVGRDWLKQFLAYSKAKSLDISTPVLFSRALRWNFFNDPANMAAQSVIFDIAFDPNVTSPMPILSSRLSAYAINIPDFENTMDLISRLRQLKVNYASVGLHPRFFAAEFANVEPSMGIDQLVLRNCIIQIAAVMLVALLMIPHPIAMFWMLILLSSITFGLVSITCTWSVDLDQIAMISLLVTMGYVIDFCPQITRAYVVSKGQTRFDKTRDALAELGPAVLEAGVGALICTLPMAASLSYILTTAFKFLLLGISLSTFHTLVVFPILLNFFGPSPKKNKSLPSRLSKSLARRPLPLPAYDAYALSHHNYNMAAITSNNTTAARPSTMYYRSATIEESEFVEEVMEEEERQSGGGGGGGNRDSALDNWNRLEQSDDGSQQRRTKSN